MNKEVETKKIERDNKTPEMRWKIDNVDDN